MIHQVQGALTDRGFLLRYQEVPYHINYPEQIWHRTPESVRRYLLDNLAYAATMHLPMAVPDLEGIAYTTARPQLEPYFFQNFLRDIPSCADMDGRSIAGETTRFLSRRYSFGSAPVLANSTTQQAFNHFPQTTATAGAIVPMSFGKDSLVTFALAEELGLNPIMVYVEEPGFTNEKHHKLDLAREFERRFGTEFVMIEHETGKLRDSSHLGVPRNEYGWGLQSTEYALLMIPIACATGASLILFGNEQSAGSSYPDALGTSHVYPCYDQTHFWTQHIDGITSMITHGQLGTGSLIEPLMDGLVQFVLAHRYPRYAPFQMSCFVEKDPPATSHWCHDCTICAKMQLLCVSAGIRPEAIGFRTSMLTEDKREHFPLLGGNSAYPFARTGIARDEQLFAFFCAARRGNQEELVRTFAGSPLYQEASRREGELRETFCTLYDPISTPQAHRRAIMSIFKEEAYEYCIDTQHQAERFGTPR